MLSTRSDDVPFKFPSYFRIAQKYALRHEYDERVNFHHAALIVVGGRVVSISHNDVHNEWIRFNPDLAKKAGRYQGGSHAEIQTLFPLVRKGIDNEYKNAKMYVVRVLKSGALASSAPCPLCQTAIKECGFIKKVYYSTSESTFNVWFPAKEELKYHAIKHEIEFNPPNNPFLRTN